MTNNSKFKSLTKIKIISTLCLFLLFANSCKKDQFQNTDNHISGRSVLKKWYDQQALKSKTFPGLMPIWDQLYVSEDKRDNYVYEVELENPNHIFVAAKGIDIKRAEQYAKKNYFKLILLENKKSHIIEGYYMNIISNEEINFKNIHYKNQRNFSGHIVYYKLNGSYNNSWTYESGKIIQGEEMVKQPNSVSTENICGSAIYGTFCSELEGYEESCTTRQIGESYYTCGEFTQLTRYDVNGEVTGGGDVEGSARNISESDVENAKVFDDGKPKIKDIKKYIDCFDDGKLAKSYTMTIFVDQPVNGKSDWFKILEPGVVTNNPYGVPTGIIWQTPDGTFFDPGHTFVTFEKNNTDGSNVRQTLGFYPSSDPFASKGAMEDNSGHEADVSYTISVTKAQFEAALQKVESDFTSKKYVLTNLNSTEYNCTDAALSWMNAAGASFGNSSTGLFKNTPGDFGQVLRNKSGTVLSPGKGITGKGPCN